MTVDAILSAIDDHGFEDIGSTRKVEALNGRYHEICSLEPWNWLEATSAVTTDAAGKVTTPAAAGVRAVERLFLGTSRRLSWMRREDFLDKYFDVLTATGDPILYYFVGGDIFTYPIKPFTTSGVIDYLKVPTDLAAGGAESTILIPPRHHRLLVYGTLIDLYLADDDVEMAASMQAIYDRRYAIMQADTQRRQYDRPDRVYFIDDSYGWD